MPITAYLPGLILLLTASLLSPNSFLGVMRDDLGALTGTDLAVQLQQGAQLFRISLAVLGVLLLVIARLPAVTPAAASAKPAPRYTVVILALLALATALRLYKLDAGLWIDEILTYAAYAREDIGYLITTYDSQNHHILYSVLASLSFDLFGEGAWALRLPAVLFGIGSIFAMYLLGRALATPREALLSSALLTLSYHHVWFSQNARGYSALLFFALLTSWLLIRALRERRRSLWIGYAVLVALGMYVQMTLLFMVLGQFVIFLWYRLHTDTQPVSVTLSEFIKGFCLSGLLTIALYAPVLPQLLGGTVREGMDTTIEAWTNPLWAIVEFARSMQIGFTGSLALLIGSVVLLTGLLRFQRTSPLVAQLLVIPALITLAIILSLGHPVFPRTFFYLMGFGVLIIMRGVLTLSETAARIVGFNVARQTLIGTFAAGMLVVLSAISVPTAWHPKQDFDGALAFIEAETQAGDTIASTGVAAMVVDRFYKPGWSTVHNAEELRQLRQTGDRTWLLYTMPLHMQAAHADIMVLLENDFVEAGAFHGTLGDGTVFVMVDDAQAVK